MKNIMYGVVISSMLTGSALAAESELKCYPNDVFMKLIDDKGLVTLYNGEKNGKINEVMMTKDRQDRKSTRLNSSHIPLSRMPSSA